MKVTFVYDPEKDAEILLKFGKGGSHSARPIEAYQALIATAGSEPTQADAKAFVATYPSQIGIDIPSRVREDQAEWDSVADAFTHRAEQVFGVALPHDVIAYLTVSGRCPYNINQNLYFVYMKYPHKARSTSMHELWHFYTWYRLGRIWEAKLGKARYEDLKESLTVLLNIECADLMPEGITDKGYSQHQELRAEIAKAWAATGDIEAVWQRLAAA